MSLSSTLLPISSLAQAFLILHINSCNNLLRGPWPHTCPAPFHPSTQPHDFLRICCQHFNGVPLPKARHLTSFTSSEAHVFPLKCHFPNQAIAFMLPISQLALSCLHTPPCAMASTWGAPAHLSGLLN